MLKKKVPYMIDIDLYDATCTMKKMEKYEDKSIFRFGMTYSNYHDSLTKFITS